MWSSLIWAIFLVIIIFWFKKPLMDILINIGSRSKKISCMGFNIDLGSSPNLSVENQLQAESKGWEFMKAHQIPLITNEEKIIRSQLINSGVSLEQAINILIYQLANKIFSEKVLWINNSIFPEQRYLLMYLNTCIKPSSHLELQNYYLQWKEREKDTEYTYEQFLNFLINQNLILSTINGYIISPFGKEYLSFIVKSCPWLIGNMLHKDTAK
jgi:hypothetical protein